MTLSSLMESFQIHQSLSSSSSHHHYDDDDDNHYLKALDIIFTHGKFPEGSSHCGHQLFVAMVLRLLFDCHHHNHYCDDDDDDDDDDGQSVDLP